MMQEVSSDDGNGSEATFEFIDQKLGNLNLSNTSSVSAFEPYKTASDQTFSGSSVKGYQQAPTTQIGTSTFQPLTQTFSAVPSSPPLPPPKAAPVYGAEPSNPYSLGRNPVSHISDTTAVTPPSSYSGVQIFHPDASSLPIQQSAYSPSPYSGVGFASSGVTYSAPIQSAPTPGSASMDLGFGYGCGSIPQQSPQHYGAQAQDVYSLNNQASASYGDDPGMFGWIKGAVGKSDFMNKIAEKAKNSMGAVITTLDPQMREYINSGGEIDVIVASDKEVKIGPIREAFQLVFGRATIRGLAAQASNVAPQPVGFSAAIQAAQERIRYLRTTGLASNGQTIVAVESFLAELMPEKWYDIGCLILDDVTIGADSINVFTQATPLPADWMACVHDETPPNYDLRWSGFAVTIGQIAARKLGVSPADWHQSLTSVPRREMVLSAARVLAGLYKSRLDRGAVGSPPMQM